MNRNCHSDKKLKSVLIIGTILFSLLIQSNLEAKTITIEVKNPDGAPVSGFRWLLEEDTTHPVTAGAEVADSLAVSIHKSYAPVVAKGHTDTSIADVNVPGDVRYVVSVLPDTDYSIIGRSSGGSREGPSILILRYHGAIIALRVKILR